MTPPTIISVPCDTGILPETQAPWPPRDGLRITRIRAIATAPEGVPLIGVRIDTSNEISARLPMHGEPADDRDRVWSRNLQSPDG